MPKDPETLAPPIAPSLPPLPGPNDGLHGIYNFLQVVLSQATGQVTTIALMHHDMQQIVQEVAQMKRVLQDGNDSLLVRTALIETKISSTADDMKAIKLSLEGRGNEDTRGKWQLVGVVAGAVFTLIAAMITATIAGFVALHKGP